MGMTMLENGLDFVIDATIHLKEAACDDCSDIEKEIKYSLLHLSSGIELILKSRLYIENWTYIFADMKVASREQLENGSFKSVNFFNLVERLEKLCDIDIGEESKKAFEALRNLRNKVEHFTISEGFLPVEARVNNALKAINKFVSDNYYDFTGPINNFNCDDEFGITKKEKLMIGELIKHTAELKEHYDAALEIAFARAENEALLEELEICPLCQNRLLKCNYDDNNECYCFFCQHKEKGEVLASEYLSTILKQSEYDSKKNADESLRYTCPDCSKISLICMGEKYKCFSCGIYYRKEELSFCIKCGGAYVKEEEDLGICTSCLYYQLN